MKQQRQSALMLMLLLLIGVSPAWATDYVLDKSQYGAEHKTDHLELKLCIADLDYKDTYVKEGVVKASWNGQVYELVRLKFINDADEDNAEGKVRATLLMGNAKAWFTNNGGGQEIGTSEGDFMLRKWGSSNHYMTTYIDFYYPAAMAGGSWRIYFDFTHSNDDTYTRELTGGVSTSTDLGLKPFDPSGFKYERTSMDNLRFTAPKLPDDIDSKLKDVRWRECVYNVQYTFFRQDGTSKSYTESYAADKSSAKTYDYTIPAEVGNPKRIDISLKASHGVKDPDTYFNHSEQPYAKTDAFSIIPVPGAVATEWRQFNRAAVLSWSSPTSAKYLNVTPCVYRVETDRQGQPKSGAKWSLRGKMASTKGGSQTYTDEDKNMQIGTYYKYMVMNVPTDWIGAKGISESQLSSPASELTARLGTATSGAMGTQPHMDIYNLQQDTTVTDRVRLTWEYSRVPVEAKTVTFKVLRSTSGPNGQWQELGQGVVGDANPSAGNLLAVEDETLPDVSARYYYKIHLALDGGKFEFNSDAVAAGLLEGSSVKTFSATKGVHTDRVKLAWQAKQVGTAKSTYIISRRPVNTAGDFTQIDTKSDDVADYSYEDTSVEPGEYYEYRIQVISGNVVQNTLYDVGFCQARGVVTGKVTYGSGTTVENVRMTLRPTTTTAEGTSTVNSLRGSSQYVSGASTGIAWDADESELAKVFGSGKDFTVQMFVRPDSALQPGTVLAEIPGEGRLTLGKQTADGYEVNILPKNTSYVDLSELGAYWAKNGDILTGETSERIFITDGATVTLYNVTIPGYHNFDKQYAAINCVGNATIVLAGVNNVRGWYNQYPGIEIANGKTLTITGLGTLNVSSSGGGTPAIGARSYSNSPCGNINIEGGIINATYPNTGSYGAVIGASSSSSCGNITISGGEITVKATKSKSPLIGAGFYPGKNCGTITITNSITKLTVENSGGGSANVIGKGYTSSSGKVTVGGTDYGDGISQNPFIYEGDGSWMNSLLPNKTIFNTGVKLPHDTYSLLTVSRSGDKLNFQVNGGEVKGTTTNKLDQLDPFSVGGASGISEEEGFRGNITEVRVWNHALTDTEKSAYGDRLLNGRENGLALYWPMDEGLDHYVFDASYTNSLANGRHAKVGNNIATSTVVPSDDQLSRYAKTGKDGTYTITGIPFVGSGSNYTLTPTLGIHEFYPESNSCFFNSSALTLSSINFDDKSSFPVRGYVTYQNTNIPVDSVQFKIDGNLQSKDQQSVMTDASGYYELDVPIGQHRIECYRNGHRFTAFPLDGKTHDFSKAETVNFTDSTLVNVTGRINGGFSDQGAPLGFKQSVNRLGKATIKLSLGKESQCSFNYTVDSRGDGSFGTQPISVASASADIKSTAYRAGSKHNGSDRQDNTHYIYITTDAETGEFSALLPPLTYKVESITFPGDKNDRYNSQPAFAQNLPMIDATNAMTERMQKDTLVVNGVKKEYAYSAKMIRQYRANPIITVTQQGTRNGAFGEEKIAVTNVDNTVDTVQVINYTADGCTYAFGKPLFLQGKLYDFDIDAYEAYENVDNQKTYREVPADAMVHISNDGSVTTTVFAEKAHVGREDVEVGMAYKTMNIEVTPDSTGHVGYEWEGGWPNMAKGHLRNASIAVKVDGRTTMWKAPGTVGDDTALGFILLGGIGSGTNFVTTGPDHVDMIIRRPPGSTSVATYTEQEVYASSHSHVDTKNGYGTGGSVFLSETPTFVVTYGTVLGIATLQESELKVVAEETVSTSHKWHDDDAINSSNTYTVNTAMSTPSSMVYDNETNAFIPENGDTYIGRSTNMLFSKGRILGLYKQADGRFAIDEREGITLSQDFGTSFVFPQGYILNTLIPNWQAIIREKLVEGHISRDHWNDSNTPKVNGKVVYYTKYTPDDPQFGHSNSDVDYWTQEHHTATRGFPSYRMVNGTDDPNVRDEVEFAINQIEHWQAIIAQNEQDKLEAINSSGYLIDNYSFGSGSKISRTTESTTKSGKTYTSNYSFSVDTEIKGGLMFNNAGFNLAFNGTYYGGYSDTNANDTTFTKSVAWTMADGDQRTALSVDVYNSPSGTWGPIFITRGGQSVNPYQGTTYTKFYAPGTKLNEGTMKVENPQLTVVGSTEQTDVPTGGQAVFTLQLSNQTETNNICNYVLVVKEGSNPDGAVLTVDGNILSNGKDGRLIKFKPGETIEKTLVVTQSNPNIITYEDIELVLRSENDPTISSDPVKLRVHFVPSSSPVELAVDHTVLNKAYLDENSGLTATLSGMDRQSKDLHGVRLRFRRKGNDAWNVLKQWTTRDSLLTQNYEPMPESSRFTEKVSFTDDGIYELQAQTFGLYGAEEVTYNSNIVEVTQDTHGPQILGMVYPETGLLSYTNRNGMHLRFNELLNANALSKSDNFRLEGGLNNVVHDAGRVYPDVAVQLNGNAVSTEAMYDLANTDYAFDMWFYRQGDGTIISLGTDDNLLALTTKDGKLQARVGAAGDVYDTGEQLPENKWTYMALSYKRKKSSTEQNSITMLYVTADDAEPHFVGKDVPAGDLNGRGRLSIGGGGMKGRVAELSVWNSDVTARQLYETRTVARASYTPGLVGYWNMAEGHGRQITDMARSRHMYMPTESWYINNENRAAHLTGDGNSALKIDIATFQPSKTDNFAYEMWFRGTSADGNNGEATLMSVRNRSTSRYEQVEGQTCSVTRDTLTTIGFADGKLRLRLVKNTLTENKAAGKRTTDTKVEKDIALSDSSYLDGNWHHLALNVRRGTSAIVYLDGQAAKVLPEAAVPGVSSHYVAIGGELTWDDATTNQFCGDVDEIRLWNAALDGRLISDRMYERMDGSYAGLVGYFPMEDIHRTAQGNVVTDFCLDNFGVKESRLKIDSTQFASTAPVESDNAPALKPGSTNLRLDNTQFNFTASADEIYFSFPDASLPQMDGNDFVVTVSNIKDGYGNSSEPVSWKFHADFASVKWNNYVLDRTKRKAWNQPLTWTELLNNDTGMPQSYEVSGLPAWVKVDKPIGTVDTDLAVLTFSVGTDVPVGRYTFYAYITDRLGIMRTVTYELVVTGDEPDWYVNPAQYESNMMLTGQIYVEDKISEFTDSKIAAFDAMGNCRGVASPEYVSTRDAYYVNMLVYGSADMDGELRFKMYDASTGKTFPVVMVTLPGKEPAASIRYAQDAVYGSYDQPVVFNSTDLLQQDITLPAGWSWMSVYVRPQSSAIGDVLPGNLADRSRFSSIKGHAATASVSQEDGSVKGSLKEIVPGNMYKVQTTLPVSYSLEGSLIDVAQTEATIYEGWNWIGTLSNSVMSVSDAFADLEPEAGDFVKNRTAFASYRGNGVWEGNLKSIVPGQGYLYKSEAKRTKTFHYPKLLSGSQAAPAMRARLTDDENGGATYYQPADPHRFPDNMNFIAVVKNGGQEITNAEVGAFVGGECRGAASYDDGYYFLTILGSSADDMESALELRVWLDGQEYVVENSKRFVSDAAYGTLERPYVLDIDGVTAVSTTAAADDADTDWWTLQGFKIGRKPTQPGVYIHHGKKVTVKRFKPSK